jgi:long-chain acyl-CoA synthetase
LETEGTERAVRLGWHNTYTYSKSLAESLLAQRSSRLRYAVLRPSIVESAVEFPEPGWNESFNCTAPLAYIMGSWFRMVPARPDAPFDVIPVDLVCRALITVSAALATGRHAPVYHVGTSDKHRCSVGRAAELIVLSHRRHLREGRHSRRERVLKSRWDAILVEPDSVLGIKTSRALVRGYDEVVDLLPRKIQKKLGKLSERVRDMDEDFAQVEKLCELFMPFMYESYYVFKSHAFDRHPVLEPEFDWGPARFDWRKYWLDIEMPGLRRWAFPLIEGKRPERYRAPHAIRLRERSDTHPSRDERSSHDEAKAHEPMLYSSTNDQA